MLRRDHIRPKGGPRFSRFLPHRLVKVATEDPEKAYRLRRLFPDLDEDAKRAADRVICRSPEYSFKLLRAVSGLDRQTKKAMGFRLCSAPAWAMRLLRERLDTTPEVFDTALRAAATRPENILSIMLENLWTRPDGSVNQELRQELEAEAVRNFPDVVMRMDVQLHPNTTKIIDMIRLGMDAEEAIRLVQQKLKKED